MKRLMSGMILVLVVLVLCFNGSSAQPEKPKGKIDKNQNINIRFMKVDQKGPPIILQIKIKDEEPLVVEGWEYEGEVSDLPSGMMMSVHFENPCRVCFGTSPQICYKKDC